MVDWSAKWASSFDPVLAVCESSSFLGRRRSIGIGMHISRLARQRSLGNRPSSLPPFFFPPTAVALRESSWNEVVIYTSGRRTFFLFSEPISSCVAGVHVTFILLTVQAVLFFEEYPPIFISFMRSFVPATSEAHYTVVWCGSPNSTISLWPQVI